jgi:hypothetical protein
MAGRILNLIGYKPNEIEKIQKMILSTDLAREPKTHVERQPNIILSTSFALSFTNLRNPPQRLADKSAAKDTS